MPHTWLIFWFCSIPISTRIGIWLYAIKAVSLKENSIILRVRVDCAFDGGDCFDFNSMYPNCVVEDMSLLLGNGVCDGSPYDSEGCRYDGGNCPIANVIKAKYPLCGKSSPSFSSNWALVENGVCDMVSMSNMVLRHSFSYSIFLIY